MSAPDASGVNAPFMSGKSPRQVISLTPLIDVVFILLVFFMLTTSFVDLRTVQLTPPKIGAPVAKMAAPIIIDLRQDGAWVGGVAFRGEALAAMIADNRRSDPRRPVVIRPASGLAIQAVVDTLDKLTRAHIDGVDLIREEK